MDFLSEIIEVKRRRVAAAKERWSLDSLRELAYQSRSVRASHQFTRALSDSSRPNIIAEFKRRSPSKGKIKEDAKPEFVAQMYETGGAAAISVLTEQDYFDGFLEDLRTVRRAASVPILRKDFIFDEYQIYESGTAGADALLLIVAALDDETLTRLRTIAEDELGLDALVEVHTKPELDRAIKCGARLIGVNNRNLHTFEVSTETSTLLARAAPRDAILVSESGLTPEEVRRLRGVGFKGFLVGEALMRAADPVQAVRDFIGKPEPFAARTVFTKICGVTNLDDARAAVDAGADLIGFNFYRRSPRFIEPDAAREIIDAIQSSRHRLVKPVGVFVNESIKEVVRIATETQLDGIQLHGEEGEDFCAELKNGSFKPFVIKAITGQTVDLAEFEQYAVDAFMVDAYDPKLRGGTGRIADWATAREAAKKLPRVFLAGGLSPENVGNAIAAVRPYAVDACSSLEVSPGKKDHTRMKEFVAAVRASTLQPESETSAEE